MKKRVNAVSFDELQAICGRGLEQDGKDFGGVLLILGDWSFGLLGAGEEEFDERGGGAYKGGDGWAGGEVFYDAEDVVDAGSVRFIGFVEARNVLVKEVEKICFELKIC